jgi:protein-tyrosine phosphatase
MRSMIDLHSHILPRIDDGSRDLAESLAIARTAVDDGIRAVAATPHVREDYPTTADEMERSVHELRAALAAENIDLEVLTGGEIALDELEHLSVGDLRRFGLGGNPAFLLLETPYMGWPLAFDQIVERLVIAGTTPVIAHPERNGDVRSDPERLVRLVERGALVQVTAASLDGRLGRAVQRCAGDLLGLGVVHMLASDAHSPEVRTVGLRAARDVVTDPALARWLTYDVPAAIVSAEPIPQRPQALQPRLRDRVPVWRRRAGA